MLCDIAAVGSPNVHDLESFSELPVEWLQALQVHSANVYGG